MFFLLLDLSFLTLYAIKLHIKDYFPEKVNKQQFNDAHMIPNDMIDRLIRASFQNSARLFGYVLFQQNLLIWLFLFSEKRKERENRREILINKKTKMGNFSANMLVKVSAVRRCIHNCLVRTVRLSNPLSRLVSAHIFAVSRP